MLAKASNVGPRNRDERDATIDEFVAWTGATIREGFGEACYRPSDDYISLPSFAAFKRAAHEWNFAEQIADCERSASVLTYIGDGPGHIRVIHGQ